MFSPRLFRSSACVSDLLTLGAKTASLPLDKQISDPAREHVTFLHEQLQPFTTCKLLKCFPTIREITSGPR